MSARSRAAVVAVVVLSSCIDINGSRERNKHAERHLAACVDNLHQGDLDTAQSRCELCLEYQRTNPECTNAMGLIAQHRGDFSSARDWYKRALRLKDEFPEARVNLGVLMMEAGELDEAETLFRSAIKIDAGYQDARYDLARCLQMKGDKAFAAASKKASGSVDPQVLRTEFAEAEKHYAEAETQLRRLHELNPLRADGWFIRGYIETQRATYAPTENRRREALARAEHANTQCIQLAPAGSTHGVQCRGNLAFVLEKLGRCDEAAAQYLGCLSLAPGEVECSAGLERTHACASIQQGAVRMAMENVVKHPGDPAAHLAVCSAAFQAGLHELAAASCENAVQLDATLCEARMMLATHYRSVDGAMARKQCVAVLQCAPADAEITLDCRQIVAQSP